MMAQAADKEGPQYQRMTWDALRKSINGLVNKVREKALQHRPAPVDVFRVLPRGSNATPIAALRPRFAPAADHSRPACAALRPLFQVNISNVKNIVPEIFAENLVRGRGLFARSIMKSQARLPTRLPAEHLRRGGVDELR